MTPINKKSHFPNQFQREAIRLINELVDITSAAFYLLDPDMRHRGVALYNLHSEVEKEYEKMFKLLDPLDPRKFSGTNDRVVTLDSQMPFNMLRQTIYYQEFMQPKNHRYVADVFFRYEGEIIAVLSLLRQQSLGRFIDQELSLLRKLQPFLEYTLNTVYLPKRVGERQSLEDKYSLTKRELDVMEMIMSGASNKLIASELTLGLATVKTHLQHIFQKMDVSSRAALLSKVIEDLST
jgi:ATP/maltotriose-dependent transcriptional regulator MalT